MTTDGIDRSVRRVNSTLVPNRPTRVALSWQLIVTVVFASIAAYWAGWHGALSAALGGAVSIISGLVFVALTASKRVRSADSVLLTALRAEGAKIASIIVLLWMVLSWYTRIVTIAFFATFAVTVIIFSLTIFVREK
jgi:ATP synthase protein I